MFGRPWTLAGPAPGGLAGSPDRLTCPGCATTAVGDVAELLDVDVDQFAGVVGLVAADRFAGGTVDMPKPVDPAGDQYPISIRCTVEGASPTRSAIATGPRRCFQRRCTTLTHDRQGRASRRVMRSPRAVAKSGPASRPTRPRHKPAKLGQRGIYGVARGPPGPRVRCGGSSTPHPGGPPTSRSSAQPAAPTCPSSTPSPPPRNSKCPSRSSERCGYQVDCG
jgi:hypothetical protein